jgi:hypothetical protein
VLQSPTANFRFCPLNLGFGRPKMLNKFTVESLEAKRGYADRSIAAMMDYQRLPTQKHTLASACNLSSSRNSYLAGIIGLLIENLLILAWGRIGAR